MNLRLNVSPIETQDCKTLAILDTSFYPVVPVSPTLLITVPGFNAVQFPFTINQVNIFNSYSLGLSSVNTVEGLLDLPDGLYTLHYSIAPNDQLFVEKYHLQTCKLEYQFAQHFAKTVNLCDTDSKLLKQLYRIEVLMEGAKANALVCNPEKAVSLYKKAKELLDRINSNCCNC